MSPMVLSDAVGGNGLRSFFLITVPVGETQGVGAENSVPQCCENLKHYRSHLSPRRTY